MKIIETNNGHLITGTKLLISDSNLLDGKPNANCLAVITDSANTEVARTVTNKFGEYRIEQQFNAGIYRLTFYGSSELDDFIQFTIRNSSEEFDNISPDNTNCDLLINMI